MAREQISKIAYKTLQQGKSIAGLAHKEISARIMNFIAPDNNLSNFNIDKNLLRYLTVKVKKLDLETNYFSKTADEAKN